MAADLFDFTAERLEHHTGFSQLEARGTLRIALKAAGLVPKNLTRAQLAVVFEQVMPKELDSRGVSNMLDVCIAVLADLASPDGDAADASATSPDEIFSRLANA